jgi:hypothetical protein
MSKSLAEHFKDWEHHTFGYGYGTGEARILEALRTFLECCYGFESYSYEYIELETVMDGTSVWLLINILCNAGIIEYGISPRFGSLTPEGVALRKFILGKSVDELYDITQSTPECYHWCEPNKCFCDFIYANGEGDPKCPNPFFPQR